MNIVNKIKYMDNSRQARQTVVIASLNPHYILHTANKALIKGIVLKNIDIVLLFSKVTVLFSNIYMFSKHVVIERDDFKTCCNGMR